MASVDQDASKFSSDVQSSDAGPEVNPPEKESTVRGEQKKRGKKRKREGKEGKEGKKKSVTMNDSPVERPSRERKSVVRYAATAPRRLSVTKGVNVPQGSGEKLKNIPNVAFKLSKRKSDESLRVLHKILFGKKTNVHFLKRNILQFSGFLWSQDEEKKRSKVMEKLNKCNKGRLLEFCDLLDIYTLKITTKKEEISTKVLEFLECPHVTREVVLSEKDTKRKNGRRGVKRTGERPLDDVSPDSSKRLKKDKKFEANKDRKKPAIADKEVIDKADKSGSINTDSGYENNDEEAHGHSYSEAEDEDNAHEDPESAKTLPDVEKLPAGRKVSHAKTKSGRSASATKKVDVQRKTKVLSENTTSKGNTASSKAKKERAAIKKDSKDKSTMKISRRKGELGSTSSLSSRSKKGKEKGKNNIGSIPDDGNEYKKHVAKNASKDVKGNKEITKAKSKTSAKKGKQDAFVGPSREKLHAVVSTILKEVDFNVATLADIIKQLGDHFDTDLMPRKAEIKDILEEVINNMSDDEDAEDGEGGAEE